MPSKTMNPATLADADRARNLICLAAIDPEITAETLGPQYLSRRFGVSLAVAALAGLGSREVRL